MSDAAKGVLAIVGACTIWGFATLYYKAMAYVPPLEVLSHRVLWTLIFFGAVLGVQGRWAEVWRLLRGLTGARVAAAGMVIAVNWGIFIWAIQAGFAVEASLGYYILPLVSVAMGVALMGERLSTLGVVQYLNPTLQAFSAVVVMGAPFTRWHAIAFGLIWAALAVYSLGVISQERVARKALSSAAISGTAV